MKPLSENKLVGYRLAGHVPMKPVRVGYRAFGSGVFETDLTGQAKQSVRMCENEWLSNGFWLVRWGLVKNQNSIGGGGVGRKRFVSGMKPIQKQHLENVIPETNGFKLFSWNGETGKDSYGNPFAIFQNGNDKVMFNLFCVRAFGIGALFGKPVVGEVSSPFVNAMRREQIEFAIMPLKNS